MVLLVLSLWRYTRIIRAVKLLDDSHHDIDIILHIFAWAIYFSSVGIALYYYNDKYSFFHIYKFRFSNFSLVSWYRCLFRHNLEWVRRKQVLTKINLWSTKFKTQDQLLLTCRFKIQNSMDFNILHTHVHTYILLI